ncbi:MAG: S8 family serine peptidase [Deltaproteobacteria bacterium]|nr:S8 family serine peptidase [Deltaproteobacteria bacterium]
MFRIARATPMAAALAVVVSIASTMGCGGGEKATRPIPPAPPPVASPGGALPSDYDGARPDPATAQLYRIDDRGVERPYAYAGPADPVRVVVDDSGVDVRARAMTGKIALEQAQMAFKVDARDAEAFGGCTRQERCRVHLIDSRGDEARRNEQIAALVYRHGGADREGGWLVFDEGARDGEQWWEIPAFDDAESYMVHGTWVAGVAVQTGETLASGTSSFAIVPFAEKIGGGSREALAALEREVQAAKDAGTLSDLDRRLAEEWRRYYARGDVINASKGRPTTHQRLADVHDDHQAIFRYLHANRPGLRQRYDAYTQSEVSPAHRTITVWAAGNEREHLGDEARGMETLGPYYIPELRGHTVVATALNIGPGTGETPMEPAAGSDPDDDHRPMVPVDASRPRLALYAHHCGALPDDWDALTHGRHYCLAAPGWHRVEDGKGNVLEAGGTSFSAPYVSAVIAEMMSRFRGQVGAGEIVRRLMNTADNSGVFADVESYGAGRIDPRAALSARGRTRTGRASRQAAIENTYVRLPSAYGDAAESLAGVGVAAFDADNFPFWTRFGTLLRTGETRETTVIPTPGTGDTDRFQCGGVRDFVPDAVCAEGEPGQPFRGLATPNGAGTTMGLAPGWSVAAFAEPGGRLDGESGGALAIGGGSALMAVARELRGSVGKNTGWGWHARVNLAADLPYRLDGGESSMITLGSALLSAWSAGVERSTGLVRSTLSIEQPARAEAGAGRIHIPVGRTRDGERRYEEHGFGLAPSRRTLVLSVMHEQPLGNGTLATRISHAIHPGHRPGPPETAAGIAWSTRF